VRLADVLQVEDGDDIVPGDHDFLLRSHLDFLVCDRGSAMAPVFAVEFDGPHHASEQQRVRDARKNRLCASARLPLLRVGDAEIQENDRWSLLDYMMDRVIAWPIEAPELSAEIERRAKQPDYRLPPQVPGIDNHALDVSIQFDIRHPFPGNAAVSKRLWKRFGIGTTVRGGGSEQGELWAHALGWKGEVVGKHFLCSVRFVLCRSVGFPEFRGGEWDPAEDVLHSGETHFSIQWALPTVPDYEWSESALAYEARTGENPYVLVELPGIGTWEVAETFAEYLALREVEDWAEANLARLASR
jgi:hypothetical protein